MLPWKAINDDKIKSPLCVGSRGCACRLFALTAAETEATELYPTPEPPSAEHDAAPTISAATLPASPEDVMLSLEVVAVLTLQKVSVRYVAGPLTQPGPISAKLFAPPCVSVGVDGQVLDVRQTVTTVMLGITSEPEKLHGVPLQVRGKVN